MASKELVDYESSEKEKDNNWHVIHVCVVSVYIFFQTTTTTLFIVVLIMMVCPQCGQLKLFLFFGNERRDERKTVRVSTKPFNNY